MLTSQANSIRCPVKQILITYVFKFESKYFHQSIQNNRKNICLLCKAATKKYSLYMRLIEQEIRGEKNPMFDGVNP